MINEYQVFARKFRPQRFKDVVAQSSLVATLKNAIRMERSAHAYLFCGCRGTGKTTLARLFAKALNCLHLSEDIEPCTTCSSCREIAAGNAIDVLEIDGASHRGIEDIRKINETIGFTPIGKRFKIYLIDEVHMLTKEAFNALLKTLEEPPAHVKFFFCTTEPHKIPATILSRCQRFNLRRIPTDKMVVKLNQIVMESGIATDQEALEILAEMSEGSLRDALSLLDQVVAFEKGKVSQQSVTEALGLPCKDLLFSLAEAGTKNELNVAFKIAEEIFSSGKNISYFLEELISHFRILLLLKNGIAPSERNKMQYEQAAVHYRIDQLVQILELLTEVQHSIKSAPSERTALEVALLKILRTHQHISLESLVQRLISLEKQLSISEDPTPKPEEFPSITPKTPRPITQTEVLPPAAKQKAPAVKAEEVAAKPKPARPIAQLIPLQEQSRFDTVMRFAAKELNGSLVSMRNQEDS